MEILKTRKNYNIMRKFKRITEKYIIIGVHTQAHNTMLMQLCALEIINSYAKLKYEAVRGKARFC